jgi:hypothetical protein
MKKNLTIIILAILVALGVSPAKAIDLTHSFVVGVDAGFDLDPDLFAWSVVGEYQVTGNVAVGPLFTFGVDNDTFLFGGSGIAKYKANLAENAKLKPYGYLGIGFLRIYEENPWDEDDWDHTTDFLVPVGGGFEYWLTDKFAWGSHVMFNISDDIFFSLFFGVRTRF